MIQGDSSVLDGKRVLMVEDREENRRLLHAILKLEGATVWEAVDGCEGIEVAERELPDLILMDLQMPLMDGMEATRILRKSPKTSAIPIIFVTASVAEETRQEAMEAGGDGFLPKPLDPLKLSVQIEEILEQRSNRNHSELARTSG